MVLQNITSERLTTPTVSTNVGGSGVSPSAAAVSETSKPVETLGNPSLNEVVDAINSVEESLRIFTQKVNFSVDKDTGRFLIKVIDSESGDVIREIPPERVLKISQQIKEILGLLFDEKA